MSEMPCCGNCAYHKDGEDDNIECLNFLCECYMREKKCWSWCEEHRGEYNV